MLFTTIVYCMSQNIGLLFFSLILLTACEPQNASAPEKNVVPTAKEEKQAPIYYTKHARCRMDCREITEQEIEYVLDNGTINQRKSDANKKPCPTYAYEARTTDGQLVRVVIADCPTERRVITCIDLENDYTCACY